MRKGLLGIALRALVAAVQLVSEGIDHRQAKSISDRPVWVGVSLPTAARL